MVGIPPIDPYPMPTEGDLPANTARWVADPDRAVLLVHDMQRFFMRAFPTGESPGRELTANASLLREGCARLGVPVAYSAQPGGMTPEQRGLLKDFWGPGMQVSPRDREVIPELRPGPEDRVFTKWRYSAFFNSGLLEHLRELGRDQLILCGVYAHVGVLMTAVEAFTNDIQVFLVADAIADFSVARHHMAVEYAAERCAVVGTTASLLAELTGPPAPTVPVRDGVGV
ncbi:isochorismatase family protein [Streptomyces alkaliphilus]|uniref:Isochorismatase family protein n=1 Tax=Streptomyces alkaliphilus TaxID=1472722 RepID=A0A7W3Y0A0_9ACTN|nr:isochorismatase family protein [Streptomyces alkaliphilus]MBB0243086.1 isochorismatase family protein [Streptomyces alkaliphilus]